MKKITMVLGMCLILSVSLTACSDLVTTSTPYPTHIPLPTLTPYATLTPYPTYTPIPPTATPTTAPTPSVGDTVVGQRWKVRVAKVETGDKFATYAITKVGAKTHLVIITLEYTYLGAGKAEFSPESVLLAYTGSAGLTGWAQTPRLYKGELSSEIVDFDKTARLFYLESNTGRTETFVYQFNKEYTDFRLYFPETMPIVVKLK
jgi:hypothetical protein